MERLYLNVLSDIVERADNVASIYRKSLLYLVSNALETDLRTPILGLNEINDLSYAGWDGSSDTGEALATWRSAAVASKLNDRTRITDVDQIEVAVGSDGTKIMQAAAHGGFDNDLAVLNSTFEHIICNSYDLI